MSFVKISQGKTGAPLLNYSHTHSLSGPASFHMGQKRIQVVVTTERLQRTYVRSVQVSMRGELLILSAQNEGGPTLLRDTVTCKQLSTAIIRSVDTLRNEPFAFLFYIRGMYPKNTIYGRVFYSSINVSYENATETRKSHCYFHVPVDPPDEEQQRPTTRFITCIHTSTGFHFKILFNGLLLDRCIVTSISFLKYRTFFHSNQHITAILYTHLPLHIIYFIHTFGAFLVTMNPQTNPLEPEKRTPC